MNWDDSHHYLMKKHKTSITTSDEKHHGLKGSYYSHGNKANVGMVNLSSVTQYTEKIISNKSHVEGICLEELGQMDLQCGINKLKSYIHILSNLSHTFYLLQISCRILLTTLI